MRLCLAGSGGGHVRQLLDLKPLWDGTDHFFVTEELALGHSIAKHSRTHFLPHVALGQAKLGAPFRMILAGARNFFKSARIVFRERPDVVVTTGAGSVFFVVLWARLMGSRIVLIDSFARFHGRSVFARVASPFAHIRIAQSAAVAQNWRGAMLFDPFLRIEPPVRQKQPLLFATVGATLAFDRLIEAVAGAKAAGAIPERIVAQVGVGGASPANLDTVETMPFPEIEALLRDADLVVCHGGTGSLITALREGCRVVAMPRRYARGEHYDDHQAEIVRAFADRGLIGIADTVDELAAALVAARSRPAVAATTDPAALIAFLRCELKMWFPDASSA